MFNLFDIRQTKQMLYLCAWLAYVLFSFLAFPALNISVMLFSIALAMVGAWLYGFTGCVVTTALTIPYHYFLLHYYSNDPGLWDEAFNPFGISTQLATSAAIAFLGYTKSKFERLNSILEQKVGERTEELRRLQHYIVQSHETSQVLLSHMLLGDIGDSLSRMLKRCDVLVNHLVFEGNPAHLQAAKLNRMIDECIATIENLEFVDHFFANQNTSYMNAVAAVAEHFAETAGTKFNLDFKVEDNEIPKHIQHQLYRITQEAITNAVRHGRAFNVDISLAATPTAYELSVINDGRPLPAKVEKGLGIRLMQHRTEQLGGTLDVESTSNGKTHLQCMIRRPFD